MTRDSDFKQVVRARMAETGEGYTAARAALHREAYEAARAEQERIVGRLFTDGRYRTAPHAPTRSPLERQEIPAWEAQWLEGFLTGRGRGTVDA